tara:strand:+ start:8164 stop:8475 length:312 start_codon:yes stop_codon:yes gene_type:complete
MSLSEQELQEVEDNLVREDKYLTKFAMRVIRAYEDLRLRGCVNDMKALYGPEQAGPYLREKHRKHIDFVPFNNYLDSARQKDYAEIVQKHADDLEREEMDMHD